MSNRVCKIAFEVEIPETWIRTVLDESIVSQSRCGSWLGYGARSEDGSKILVYENQMVGFGRGTRAQDHTVKKWLDGEIVLSRHWHVIDEDVAIKAYTAGVMLWGVGWYTGNSPFDKDHHETPHQDGHGCQQLLQLALFGKVKYV